MFTLAPPLLELDRFFAAPPDGSPPRLDAQSQAVERFVLRCEEVRPHLYSLEALERFAQLQHDPPRLLRRISLALAIELPEAQIAYGRIDRSELETFRLIAQRRLAAVIWVFA